MADKVQKIKQWISREQDGLMDAQGNFDYPEHQGAYDVLCNLDAYIDSLQEEPVSKDFEMALTEMVAKAQRCVVEPWVVAAQWKDELIKLAKSEEPVSEELEKAAVEAFKQIVDSDKNNFLEIFKAGAKWQKAKDKSTTEDLGEYINEISKQFPEVSFAKLSRIAVRVAKWQKEHLWKPADGDDLPEIDKEVIVLTQPYPLENSEYAVSFAHRPNPDGWDGKSLTTGEVEHYIPKTYGKGGWNIPDIVYWLDVELQKEIER